MKSQTLNTAQAQTREIDTWKSVGWLVGWFIYLRELFDAKAILVEEQ